jgi:hypothetical protein
LKEAPAEIDSLGPRDTFSYWSPAKKHSIARTTLRAHHRGEATSRAESVDRQRLLPQRDEVELVKYIRSLTEKHCPPTRQMIINFATPLCRWEPSDTWVTRLIHRHNDHLLTA